MTPLPKLSPEARARILDEIEVSDVMGDGQAVADMEILLALHDRVHKEALGLDTGIDTKSLGLATHLSTKRRFFQKPKVGDVEIRFDTGITLTGPRALLETMVLHLEEAGPE